MVKVLKNQKGQKDGLPDRMNMNYYYFFVTEAVAADDPEVCKAACFLPAFTVVDEDDELVEPALILPGEADPLALPLTLALLLALTLVLRKLFEVL
jgi:hypothetical protein